jgi:hypothetical protein
VPSNDDLAHPRLPQLSPAPARREPDDLRPHTRHDPNQLEKKKQTTRLPSDRPSPHGSMRPGLLWDPKAQRRPAWTSATMTISLSGENQASRKSVGGAQPPTPASIQKWTTRLTTAKSSAVPHTRPPTIQRPRPRRRRPQQHSRSLRQHQQRRPAPADRDRNPHRSYLTTATAYVSF